MKKVPLLMVVAVILFVWAPPSAAQATRGDIIAEARDEVDDTRAIARYISALDPALGEPDSLWAVVALEIADRLTWLDQQPLASTWLRWLARHGAHLQFDRGYYDPALVEEYDRALEEMEGAPETLSATTTWRWPQTFDLTLSGSVEATALGQPASVTVEGQEGAEAAGSLSLVPGTYTLVVSAEGYEPAQVVREILPGVTTILDVDAVPLFPAEVQDRVADNLVRISYTRGGREICGNGLITGPDGFVLTTLGSVPGGTSLRVSAFGDLESFPGVPVVTTDPDRDLAVLRLNTTRAASFPSGSTGVRGQYAWSVFYQGCGALTSSRTRLADWPGATTSLARLTTPLPEAAGGSPLVDREGYLLGYVTGPTTYVPVGWGEDLLEQARADLAQRAREAAPVRPAEISSGGKFPWKLVGAGLGVAGVAVALAGGGGGGGGGGNEPPPPTTGSIKIIWSGGG